MGMTPDQLEFLSVLNAHQVNHPLIGGYAVEVHSALRTTKDLNIFIRSDKENSEVVHRAFASFGAPLAGYSPEDFYDGTTFQIGQPPSRINILQKIDGLDFDGGRESRVEGVVEGLAITVISSEKLVKNKLATVAARRSAECGSASSRRPGNTQKADDLA